MFQLCEEFGFWGVSFGENHFSNYGYSPNPLMLAVGIVRNTERLNIATGIAVLPYWNPVRFAEDAATADLLASRGCGEGQGYHFGRPMPAEEFARRFLSGEAPLVPDSYAEAESVSAA